VLLTEVWVPGLPKTKGSLNFVGDRYVEESVKGSARWRVLVADAVRRDRHRRFHGEQRPSDQPVSVRAVFWLPPPAASTRSPIADVARATGAPVHAGSGDVDKLARNVLDALGANAAVAAKNGGAYLDDVQVVTLGVLKVMTAPGLSPGMLLRVDELGVEWLTEARTNAFLDRRALEGQ
jgi:hypothetical protein